MYVSLLNCSSEYKVTYLCLDYVALERVNKPAVQRGNSLTDDEVNTAKQFRKNVLKGNSKCIPLCSSLHTSLITLPFPVDVTLSAIARSSAAVSTSPPNNRSIPIAAAAEVRFPTLITP